jgi:hypothetical protein
MFFVVSRRASPKPWGVGRIARFYNRQGTRSVKWVTYFWGSLGDSVKACFCLGRSQKGKGKHKRDSNGFQRLYWASKSVTSFLFNFLDVSKLLQLEALQMFQFILLHPDFCQGEIKHGISIFRYLIFAKMGENF